MKAIELRKVEVNALMALLSRSLKVSSILDFKLSSSEISSIIQNDATTFWKEWKTSTKGIFESEPFEEIEILIYNGSFFKDKVLPLFAKSQNMVMTIELNDENQPVRIHLNDPGVLAITFPTTRLDLAQEKLTPEEHSVLFGIENATTSFELSVETLNSINKLKSLSYSCGYKPVTAITFESKDGVLRAFDSTFDLIIANNFDGGDFSVKIDKGLLDLINSEDHKVYLCPTNFNDQEFDRFVFVSNHSSIEAVDVAILLKEVNSDELDPFNEDNGGSWDQNF